MRSVHIYCVLFFISMCMAYVIECVTQFVTPYTCACT